MLCMQWQDLPLGLTPSAVLRNTGRGAQEPTNMLTELNNAGTEIPRLIKREGKEAIRLDTNVSRVYIFPNGADTSARSPDTHR